MQIYLVGGAVRDQLLNKKPRENDYVVVGAKPSDLINQGFKQVGKDFPVFLHPMTQEEYALARTERKTGQGYHGFETDCAPNVTLEEDLLRRDLTINAIAQGPDKKIIDPYNGASDLKNKTLRHVSSAFSEDPLRILRVARFQAMLPEFTIHPDTLELMKKMCAQKHEINAISNERIWLEMKKACLYTHFELFWQALDQCDYLKHKPLAANTKQLVLDLKNSSGTDLTRLLTGLWQQPSAFIEQLIAMNPPSELKSGAQIILNCREYIKLGNKNNAQDVIKTIQRIDPYRRPERAQKILSSMTGYPDDLLTFWTQCIDTLSAINPAQELESIPPQERAAHLNTVRTQSIMHLLGS